MRTPRARIEQLEAQAVTRRHRQAKGLTMAQVLARPDGPAILGALADQFFAQQEGGDHADTPREN